MGPASPCRTCIRPGEHSTRCLIVADGLGTSRGFPEADPVVRALGEACDGCDTIFAGRLQLKEGVSVEGKVALVGV